MDSTTQKGFRILEKLAQSDTGRGISDLSRETELTKSNVQRIIATLCDLGYAEKDPQSNRYYATMRMWERGLPVLMRNRILRAARSALKMLRQISDETVVLCIRDGMDLVYIEKLESATPIRLSCPIGTRVPLYNVAAGRVMAAHFSDEDKALFLKTVAEATDAPSYDMRARLATIAARGYDLSESGFRAGVNSVAVPVWDDRDEVVASIAISGPEERLSEEKLVSFLPAAFDAASKVSAGLGHMGGGT
jgi:DNA-binding IclR family transcriptional regulator